MRCTNWRETRNSHLLHHPIQHEPRHIVALGGRLLTAGGGCFVFVTVVHPGRISVCFVLLMSRISAHDKRGCPKPPFRMVIPTRPMMAMAVFCGAKAMRRATFRRAYCHSAIRDNRQHWPLRHGEARAQDRAGRWVVHPRPAHSMHRVVIVCLSQPLNNKPQRHRFRFCPPSINSPSTVRPRMSGIKD